MKKRIKNVLIVLKVCYDPMKAPEKSRDERKLHKQ